MTAFCVFVKKLEIPVAFTAGFCIMNIEPFIFLGFQKFFQQRAGRGNEMAETLSLQWIQGSAAQRWAVQNDGGALGRTDCSCEADEIMLT